MEKSYSVYIHTFPNGKKYVGITSQKPEKRWENGKGYRRKNNGKYQQPLMAKATLKYKWDDISHEIVFDGLTKEEAEQKEIELIAKYQSNNPEYGYNITSGGEGSLGWNPTEEWREKQRKLNKGKNNPMYGKSAMKGKHHTEEVKRKIGEKHKKPVRCIETGITYDSLQTAEEKTGIKYYNISACCNGKQKTAGGYNWEYYIEEAVA